MHDIATPDDPVTCGLCGHRTSVAMIVTHLKEEHDIDPAEIADAPIVDSTKEDNPTNISWYVSDIHCRRAIGYLSAKLVEDGYLQSDFELPLLLELWGEALEKTMDTMEPSPIGPDTALAIKILRSDLL